MCWKNLVGWDENSQSALGISEINLIYCLLLTDIHTEKLKTPSPRPLSAAGPGLSHGTLVFLNWSHMGFLWTAALPALSPTTGPAGCSTPGAPPALTLVPAGLFSYISHSPLPAAVADFPFPRLLSQSTPAHSQLSCGNSRFSSESSCGILLWHGTALGSAHRELPSSPQLPKPCHVRSVCKPSLFCLCTMLKWFSNRSHCRPTSSKADLQQMQKLNHLSVPFCFDLPFSFNEKSSCDTQRAASIVNPQRPHPAKLGHNLRAKSQAVCFHKANKNKPSLKWANYKHHNYRINLHQRRDALSSNHLFW